MKNVYLNESDGHSMGVRSPESIRIAYLILVHRLPDQFKRLFKAIYESTNFYLIILTKRQARKSERKSGAS